MSTPSMPDPGSSLHIASVDYACTFSALPVDGGLVSFSAPDPVHFTFAFETGVTPVSPGVVQVSWDYAWFSQAQVEADISGAMSSICEAVSALLQVTLVEVDSAVQVRRVWTFKPNLQGPGVSSGAIVSTDFMQYPPLVSAADTARGTEAASVAQTAAASADAASMTEAAQAVP